MDNGLARHCESKNGPAIVTRALRTADIAVTEIRCDKPLPEMCGPIQQEDAFLVTFHLSDSRNREYWEDGRRAPVCDLRAGESCLHDLKRDPTAFPDKAFHSLVFYLPRAALDAIADDANAPRIRNLSYEPGAGAAGRVIHRVRDAGFTSDLYSTTDSRLTSRHVSNGPLADI